MIQLNPNDTSTHVTIMVSVCLLFCTSVAAASKTLQDSNTGADTKPPPTKTSAHPGWEFELDKLPGFTNYGMLKVRPKNKEAWGTVCDAGFDQASALAACRSVGFDNITTASIRRYILKTGKTYIPIHMNNVKCKPSDKFLQDCSYVTDNGHCYSDYDVSWLQCGKNPQTHVLEFELVDKAGTGAHVDGQVGRMQVKTAADGVFKDICGDDLDHDAYTAACRTLGYTAARTIDKKDDNTYTTKYGMNEVKCPTQNSGLKDCTYKLILENQFEEYCASPLFLNCHGRSPTPPKVITPTPEHHPEKSHTSGVQPQERTPTPEPSPLPVWQFKLIMPPYFTNYGLLTLRPNSDAPWGSVCRTDYNNFNALAACRSIGFDNITTASMGKRYEKDTRYTNAGPIYKVKCDQDPSDGKLLQDCSYINADKCTHKDDVWLQCGRNQQTHVLDFKLVDEPSTGITGDPRVGRMMVQTTVNGVYKDICENGFDDAAITAACRTLGFNVTRAGTIVKYGFGNDKAMDDVRCPANNGGFKDCTYKLTPETQWQTPCPDSDLSCICPTMLVLDCHEHHPEKWKFRIEYDTPGIGRLEMQPDESHDWGTVCSNMFNDYSALIMCKAVGFTDITSARAILNYSVRKPTAGSVHKTYLTDVVCNENSTSLSKCEYVYRSSGISPSSVCTDMTDVGIDCSGQPPNIPTDIAAITKTPTPEPSSGPTSVPTKNTTTTPLRPPSGIFTATVADTPDIFKAKLARYMNISPASVEVLSPVPNSNQVRFRFIDHNDGHSGTDTPNPKALETGLLRLWGESPAVLRKATGMDQMHGPAAESSPGGSKGPSVIAIVLGVIGAGILVGLAVGGVIMYKKRSGRSSGFVRDDEELGYVPMEDFRGVLGG